MAQAYGERCALPGESKHVENGARTAPSLYSITQLAGDGLRDDDRDGLRQVASECDRGELVHGREAHGGLEL